MVSDGAQVLLDSEEAGDEPFMLARNLPGVVVLVDKNRVKAGTYRDPPVRLRHPRARRRLPVPPAQGPAQPAAGRQDQSVRQRPPAAARHPARAGQAPQARPRYVFLTKSNGQHDPELEELIQKHNPGVDVIECAHRPQYPAARRRRTSGARSTILKGRRVGAFSGIAAPESFEHFLRELGANLIYTKRFLDHYRFTQEDLNLVFGQARAAGLDFS